jgi:hypothetical protein
MEDKINGEEEKWVVAWRRFISICLGLNFTLEKGDL